MNTTEECLAIYKAEIDSYLEWVKVLKLKWKGEWMNADWGNLLAMNARLDGMEKVLGLTKEEIRTIRSFRVRGPLWQGIRE